MSEPTTRFLGLDVHMATIAVAVAEETGPPILYGTIANDPGAVRKLVNQFSRGARLVAACEAGPTGYVLHRQLTSLGVECQVVAPIHETHALGGCRGRFTQSDRVAAWVRQQPGSVIPLIAARTEEQFRDKEMATCAVEQPISWEMATTSRTMSSLPTRV